MIKVLYFARLREQLGVNEQKVSHLAGETIADLAARLVEQGGKAWQVLLDEETVCAVNQEISGREVAIQDGDEVAFFHR